MRFLYFPIAVLALLAVGVHAAADALDQKVLWAVDHLDAAFDAVVSRWAFSASWVNWVDLDDRVRIARAVAFVWELAGDCVLALPVLGFGLHEDVGFWNQLKDLVRRPTLLRVSRPACALALALVGGNAVASMVHGELFIDTRWLGPLAAVISRGVSIAVLIGTVVLFGVPAAAGHLRRADAFARAPAAKYWRELGRGTVGSAILIPLALVAALQALPLLAWFR